MSEENKTVQDYKEKEADKFEVGMAKNNAATIIAGMLTASDKPGYMTKDWALKNYEELSEEIFHAGKRMRLKILGY